MTATTPYTSSDLMMRAETLHTALVVEHLEAPQGTCKLINRGLPFEILVHNGGATLIVTVKCQTCRRVLTRSEAL